MATEAVIIQEPVSLVEKIATEAVTIQEPISMEKLATEAVIIAEPISMVKIEEESKHLTLEVGASNNGVETAYVVAEGDLGITKGESFLMSPEISKVANETCGVLDHFEVDGTPFKAEKRPEDEEKTAVWIEEEAGTRGIEKGDTVESLKDAKETVTEASSTEQVNEVDDNKPEKLPAEAGKDRIILDSLGETLTEKVAESEEIACMEEKLEEVSSEEIKCTNGENDGIQDKNSVMKTEELHPRAELPVGNEHKKPHEFSGIQPEEQGNEAIGASEKKEEDSEDVSKAYRSRDNTNPEHILAEAAATIDLKSETSRTDEENVKEDTKDCTAETMNEKSEEENTAAMMSIKEVCENLETDNTVENAEEQIILEEDNKDHTALKEVCKGSETAASGTAKEEINLIEVKEELVHSSSFELEESEENTEKETSVISTANLDCTSHVAETKETKIEEAETETDGEEEKNEINNEGIGVESADIDVKSADSYVTSEKDIEIHREEDGMQDRIPNQGSENQMAMPTEEIQLKEVLGDEMKKPSIIPLDELRKDEESVLSMPEGNIREIENIGFVQQNREGNSKEEIFEENFQQKNESEKKPECPLNVVYEDVNTAISGEPAETSTDIEEETSINDHEERSEGERREETPTDHLQIEANESYETAEVKVSNETADDLHVTDLFIGQPVDNEHEKQNEFSDVQPVENEALENKEEEILQELEDSSTEKPEPKDAMENVEDNLKQEETNKVHEGLIKEDCTITDDLPKSTEEDENEDTLDVEVCEKLELDKTVEIAEKQILDEEDNNGQTTLTAEMMEEKAKEVNTAAMVSITEASNSVIEEMDSIEETAKPNNDTNLFDIVKESKEEITPIKVKEDHVFSSSSELEESKNDTEEEKPASCSAETEETNVKGAEAEEEKNERNNVVVVEERGLETTELEGIGVYSAEMNVKSPSEKDTEIPREIDATQDKVPNAGSEVQLEMNAEEIPSKETLGYEVKEYEPALIEEREISDETSEKDRDLYEHSEIPPSQATDEKLMQNEDSPQSDVPKAEPEDTGNESRHEVKEQLAEEPNVEVTNVSTEEVHREQDNQTDASEAKTLQDEKPSDFGLKKTEQKEDGKPLDEAADLEETAGEENLAKNLEETESLKEDSEIGKEDQIPGVIIVNDNAKVEDYNSVSNECLNEAESKEQIVAENLEVEEDSANDGEASHVVKELEETRQDEESGDPVNVHSEDREAEKKTEEIIHDSKRFHEESCIEAVTEVRAETRLNNTDENSKALNISTVETNPEIVESDANQETEVEKVQLEEISSELDPDVRANDNDDVQKQNINVESLDKDDEIRIENPVEKIEEDTQKDTEIEHEIQEDSSETKTTEEVCLSNEEQRELKAVSEEETIIDQDPQNDEPEEHSQTASSTLPSEESEHGTRAISEEIKCGITKEEVQTKLDAATGDEVTGEQTTSLPLVSREKDEENICTDEKTEEDKTNETDMIPDKISEGFSVAETTTELCLEKEELLELDDAEKEDEKTKEEETIKDEIEEDAKGAKKSLEICSQKERSDELEAVGEDETTAVESSAEKISDARVLNQITALPSEEDICESTITAEMIESEKTPDEDASLQKDQLREDEALAVHDDASSQVILTEKPDDLPDPVDTLPTDHLHPTTSTLPSEVQGDEKKEIELEEEEESPEKILEQTQEIEEASDFNTEIHEKAFKNELLEETDVAIEEKLVKARTEAGEIIPDEVSAEKVIVESQKTGENEDLVEDETVEAPGQASVARIQSTAVVQENVALAGFEEKPESESAPVAEDQSEETFPESSNSQDDETSIDLQNQETEKQMKEEPDDKLEDEHIINRDQNTNETEAVILSEEVDKEVEKAEGSEGVKEYDMEKESSTNEIHPVPNGDEEINEVEDYSAVSTECIQEAKSEEQIQTENPEVEENSTNEKEGSPVMKELDEAEKGLIAVTVDELNKDHELGETKSEASKTSNADELGKIDDIGPPNTALEVKHEEPIQTSVCTLHSEDDEIRIENPVEKIEEEAQKETEIEHEIQEDSSETKTIEEVCLSNEEQRELKAVSGEETIANQDPQNDEPEEHIQTASSTLPSEESEHGTEAISEEIKYGITKEEVQTKLDDATGDEVTGEQTTSPPLVSRENDEENTCTVEKTEEKINEAGIIPDKISEGFPVAEATTELCLEKELPEVDDAEKEGEKTKEGETIKDEIEEDAKTRLEICSQTERSVELEAVGEDETTAVESSVEKISDAQVLNLTTALPSKEDECESTITTEMIESEKTPDEDASLQKDQLREDEALAVDDDPSSQVILTEKPDVLPDPVDTLSIYHLHPTSSTLPSEVQGDEKKEIELEEEEEEKSPEQKQEIEEASDFNTEVHEKAFKNELLDETDVAIQAKFVKARTEAGEIIPDEVPAEKVIVEAQKTSENEDLVKDKTVEAPGQASVASIESTAVIEENVVLACFEEKPEFESAPVAEDQSEETFPKSNKSQDDETSIDVQNQETEEQMKDELKDKLQDEHIISREQNTNETKAVILSDEDDKEVEKAEGSEGIKEYVMEKEYSTNEIHPVPKGDEAINEVEDYSAVSAECIEEAKSEEQIQAKNSEVEENSTNGKEGSPVMKELDEGKQDKEFGDPVNVHGEDKEAEEKDEVIDDLKLGHDMSRSEAMTEERAETSLNDTELNEELVNTLNISSVQMSLENNESDASQETEEVEKVQLEEISSSLAPEVPTNNNDDVEVNKRDADEFYMAKDKIAESENGLSVEKVDQLNQYEFVETKSKASKKSLTAELEADKVEETEGVPETSSDYTSQRVETILKDDGSSTNTFPEEKSEEQLQSSTHTLLCEVEEITTARPIEKIKEEIQNDAEIKQESGEDSSCTKSVDMACVLNEEQRELKTVSEEETIADKSLPNDKPETVLESETNTSRVIAEESEKHGATKEKKTKEAESFEDEKLPQLECTRELQGALENGETAVHILPGETSADNLHATASTLPSEVKENETTETELKEDESPKKIQEQTGEIEEASNLNKETCKKPFDLLGETDDGANEIMARDETEGQGNRCEKTEEGNEITANEDSKEVMEDKEVTETPYSTSHSEEPMKDGYGEDELNEKLMKDKTHEELKTSEIEMIENQIKDKTTEDPGQASVAKIETTEVTEENVAITGFEEKPKSETEPVIEDQSNETIPENTTSQDDGTSLDVPDQETEEQIKEELKDKPEDEDSINREENTNEVTKAVILSEEVDKEVEEADGSDDIKENIHPVSNVDEATNEVEDYGAVSTECIQEAKSEEQIQAENSEVEENSTNDKEGSHTTKELDERKQDEKYVDPVSVHSEDREAEEKAEIIDDLKLGHGESHSEAVTEERAETSLNYTEVNEELVNTSNISSAKTSLENIGSDANQETEEVEKVQLEEISSDLAPEVPTNNNDEVEVIKRDPDEFYTAKDQNVEADNGLTVQKVDQLNQDHELIETQSESSKKSLIAELETNENEETEAVPETFSDDTSQRVETILKDDDSSTDTFPEEKLMVQLQSSTCTLFSEDEEITTARPEKIEEEIQNDAGIKHKIGEDSLDSKIIEEILHREDEALAEDNIDNASAPNILSEKPEEQIQNPAVTLASEEHKHETINEVDKTGEMKNGDSHAEEAVEEKSTEKDETREPEETLEGETNTCRVIPEESAEHGTVTEEKKIKEAESFQDEKSIQSECTRELQGALEDGAAVVHILPGETSAVNLHPAASTLPSEIRGNETKETELQEDESPEKIQEQTREIEEVSIFNIETCGRAFENELLTETEDAANEREIVITNETAVIEVLKEEVMEDKEVTETSYSTSHLEEMIKDGSGEDELKDKLIQDNKLIVEAQKTSENEIIENQIKADHASISRIETIAVAEENVEPAPPGFEEKPKSDLEPVAEDQSKETLPEHTKSQDDETRTDVQNRETEEQIKEELKDKVEAEGSINGEQNKNEVTKAVTLSEKVDGSEDIKEHVIEEEGSTNELHPVSKGDETTNEVEDYSAVSIESIETAESEEQIQAGNLEDEENSTNNKEGSFVTKELDERRQDEESGDPVNVHGEDREAEEKVEIEGVPEPLSDNVPPRVETILKVDSTSTNTFLEDKPKEQLQSSACTFPNEEQRELKAVSEEETIADKVLPNDESKEQIQSTSLTFPSEEREHGVGAISEEREYGKTREEVAINLDVVTGDEITGKQTRETNKPEEITSSPLVSMEKEANVSSVEQIEEEKLGGAEIPERISENPFDAKKAAETCLENEAIKELDDAKKDTQALQMEESKEHFFTSDLPVENLKHRTEGHDEVVKEVEMLEKEGPQEPEAVIDQETIVARASITEESQKIETICTVEMLDEEKRKEAVKVEEEKCEDSSSGETEELNEFHLVTKEETTSYLAFSEEQLHSFSASAITSEESEHETKEKEDEKTCEEEIIIYEIEEDASDAKATVEICSQKGSSVEVEAVAEDEMTAGEAEKIESKKIEEAEFLQDDSGEDATLQKELLQGDEALVVENSASSQTIPKEKPEEEKPNPVVTLPSEEHKHDTINEVDMTEEEKIKEEMKNGYSDGIKTVEEVCREKDQTKEAIAVMEEDESLEKIREQTGEVEESSDINMEINEKALYSELLDETEDAAIKENFDKAIDGSGGEANQYEKIKEGNEIILNEVSKEEATSHSTSQSEEPTKDEDYALKDELIEDKTYKELIVEAQKASENEITDGVVKNPGQASVVRTETTKVTEDHLENMGITSSVVEEYVLIDLRERVVECSQKVEVRDVKETYPEVVEHGVEKTEDKLLEDSTKISSSDGVESFKETEDEKMGELEITKDETQKDASDTRTAVEMCSQVDTSVKLEAFTENEMTSCQTLTAKKSEEQMQNPTPATHSKEEQCVRASIAEEMEIEKMEEEELQGDNEEDATFQKEQPHGDEALAVENKASLQTIPTDKSQEQIPNPVVTLPSEEHKHETVNEFDKPEEENMKKEELKNRDFDGGETVVELSTEKDETKGAAAMSEGEINHLHITASALPSDVQGDETNKAESKENESPKKTPEQTGETEEASNFTPEVHEKASDNETETSAIKENIVRASDGFAQTNEGNEIILNEVSKEEIVSYSTSHSEELTKDASLEDAVNDEQIEDKTYEELIVESQKPSENEMNEKQIEGGIVGEQVQASVVRIETSTESSTELSVAEGKQILKYIQQTGETTKTASDMQIPRELDHIENTGITSLVAEEHVPVSLQDRVAESSQKTEVREIYPGGLECDGEITVDCSGEEVIEESILTQDSIMISSSDNVESFAKEAKLVPQDMIEGDAKDDTNVSRILQAEKSEKQSLAPVDAVVVEELKEVETRDKSTSDTKTGGEIRLEKEENKEPKAVVVQETIVTQAPQTKDPVSHFEDSSQEDEHAGDETNETFKIPTHEIQNEKPSLETQKDDAKDNIRKETVAEDETVKDDMNEATIVREEIPGKEDPIECKKMTNSTGKQQFPTEQQDEAFETSDKAVVGGLEPGTAEDICAEAGVASGKGEKPDNLGVEKPEEPESEDSAKLSLYDLLQRSTRETIQGTKNVIEERELKASNEEPPEEEAKTDEEVEGDENSKTESGTKPHKKSHNILSGVGSKVKHSISKMKKAITGKSSYSKESKPISPKESKK